MKFWLLFLFWVWAFPGFCQETVLSRAQALADIDTLVNRIVYTHPNPFTVCPESVFRKQIVRIREDMPDTLTAREFARELIPAVAMLGDGHTACIPPYPEPDALIFPQNVEIDWRDTTLYLAGGRSKVLFINNIPTCRILGNMVRYISGEGMHFRFKGVQGWFSELLDLLYAASAYSLVWVEPDGKQVEKVVRAVPYKEVRKKAEVGKNGTHQQNIDYAFRLSGDEETMLLEFNRFYDPDKFKVVIDSMFREIKERKIKNLVIDLRKNGGGNSDLGDELLQYLMHVPFAQIEMMEARVGRYTRSQSNEWRNFANNLRSGSAANGSYSVSFTDSSFTVSLPLTPLRKEPFRVSKRTKVYLLISNNTFSAAAIFSWAFQYFGGGIVIGEESGGMNVTFGDLQSFTLPYSHLQCAVSWKRFYQYGADYRDIHGTIPDVEVPAEQALEYTMEHLIHKGKK